MNQGPTVAVLDCDVNRDWILVNGEAKMNWRQKLGEGWGTQERVYVLSFRVRCPLCGKVHGHGVFSDQEQPGDRVADCQKGGYNIVWREGQEPV
jgi:hypothetical protein